MIRLESFVEELEKIAQIKSAEPKPPKGISLVEWDKKLQAMGGPDRGKQAQTPKLLYHLTPEKNLKRVQRFGLRPRSTRWGESKRRPHANRVYFTTTPESSLSMVETLKKEDVNLGGKKAGDTYALVTIDPSKIPKMRLRVDPEEPKFSVYGSERIRPPAIVGIKRGTLGEMFGKTDPKPKKKAWKKLLLAGALVVGGAAAGGALFRSLRSKARTMR